MAAANARQHPPPPPPSSMADALSSSSDPSDALRALSDASEALALKLAEELASSLATTTAAAGEKGGGVGGGGDGSPAGGRKESGKGSGDKKEERDKKDKVPRYPIPLPDSLREATDEKKSDPAALALLSSARLSSSHGQQEDDDPSPLSVALASSASILSSLSKVASGGSRASREMRELEDARRSLDEEADDVSDALRLRQLAAAGADALGARRYADAASAVRDFKAIRPSERAVEMAGAHTVRGYERTRDVLQRSVLERYEHAVAGGDIAGLSELTPLLGMLDLADKGVGLYLRYSQSVLGREMSLNLEADEEAEQRQIAAAEKEASGARISRAEQRRREARRTERVTVCTKLAKVYNAAVTHLRHHLPMVAFALGEADGDAALVQLVHLEVERRAVDLIKEYGEGRDLAGREARAETVAARIEERYAGGGAGGDGLLGLGGDDLWAAMGLGGDHHHGHHHQGHGSAPPSGNVSAEAVSPGDDASVDDCGFRSEVGRLPEVDASMDEIALLLQHTESYERFVRHAVDEVNKARELRRRQKLDELRRRREAEDRRTMERGGGSGGSGPAEGDKDAAAATAVAAASAKREEEDKEIAALEARGSKPIEILPAHTPLNEVVAEVGGYYSGLERCLLLASMQRAFLNASRPDDRSFAPLAILNVGGGGGPDSSGGAPAPSALRHPDAPGARALQTSVVEECLYAAQRSTLRAFATGHTGTASAAANFCADSLGRVLLEVLTRRAEFGVGLLKPGDGLLAGQGGLGQEVGRAALAVMRDTAKKAGRKGLPVGAVAGGAAADRTDLQDDEERAMLRRRVEMGVARACANLNDLEVAADYARRLEAKFLGEVETSYPRGHETEQLLMCVKSLGPVKDSFRHASDRTVEMLVGTVSPRIRSVVNDAVGQESTTSAPFSTAFGAAAAAGIGGVSTPASKANAGVRMNYDLDDDAYELAQVSEGYMSRLCASLDETVRPLRSHLCPRLSDAVLLGVLAGASKRLEAAVRRTKFTALGALALDSDVRHLVSYGKERVSDSSPELTASNVALYRACRPLARLAQIASLMNVDDLDDVLDLISAGKRKGQWDLSLDDAKALLNLRVDFEGRKVNELLRISEEE